MKFFYWIALLSSSSLPLVSPTPISANSLLSRVTKLLKPSEYLYDTAARGDVKEFNKTMYNIIRGSSSSSAKAREEPFYDAKGRNALTIACEKGHIEILGAAFMMEQRDRFPWMSVNRLDKSGHNCFHLAIVNGHWDTFSYILLMSSLQSWEPSYSALFEAVDILEVLLQLAQNGPDPSKRVEENNHLEEGIITLDLEAPTSTGKTPLFLALRNEQTKMFDALIELGADPFRALQNNITSDTLSSVISNGNQELITRILTEAAISDSERLKSLIESVDSTGNSLVIVALLSQRYELAFQLLQMGSNVNSVDPETGKSVLHLALEAENPTAVKILDWLIANSEVDFNQADLNGVNPMRLLWQTLLLRQKQQQLQNA